MRSRLLLGVSCLVALLGAASSSLAVDDTARGPRISVSPERFDFGSVLPDQKLTREFVVRNVGAADLLLEKVSTSCGCTVAEGYTSLVKPGKSTVLRVTLSTPPTAGRLQKSVLVRSNDPTRATVELKVEATVGAAGR